MPDSTLCQEPKQPNLLDQVRQYLRLHHYSIHTERSYVDWIVRFIRFHRMRSRDDLFPVEPKIEAFLTHLAMEADGVHSGLNLRMTSFLPSSDASRRIAKGMSTSQVRSEMGAVEKTSFPKGL